MAFTPASGAASKSGLSALYRIKFQNGLAWRGLVDSPFYLRVKRDTQFSERHKERTVAISPGATSSPDLATALMYRAATQQVTFQLDTKPDYVVGSISNKVLKSNNKAMIRDAFENELEAKGYAFGRTIQRKLWGYAGGSRATCTATSGTTITMSSAWMTMGFHPGDVITIATDNGTAATPSGTVYGPFTLVDVDPDTPDMTTSETLPTLTTGTYYIFNPGEYGQNWSGLLGWAPPTAPSASESFLGVDRTAHGDTRRLSGFRPFNIRSDKTRTVSEAFAYASRLGVRPNAIFCNPIDLDKWVAEMPNPPAEASGPSTFANVNYSGVKIRLGSGTITVMEEPELPTNVWLGTRMELWTLRSQGDVPMRPTRGELMQESTADAWQFRLISYACLDCTDPGDNIPGLWQAA